jgi:hypothetical protein
LATQQILPQKIAVEHLPWSMPPKFDATSAVRCTFGITGSGW